MNETTRINQSDSFQSCIEKLAECNPGAMLALIAIANQSESAPMGTRTPLLQLDAAGIYGPRIWMLYKDVCNENAEVAVGLLNANQQGVLSGEQLDEAIETRGANLDVADVLARISQGSGVKF